VDCSPDRSEVEVSSPPPRQAVSTCPPCRHRLPAAENHHSPSPRPDGLPYPCPSSPGLGKDCRTAMVVRPEPPPSTLQRRARAGRIVGRSRHEGQGRSRRAFGEVLSRRRAHIVPSSMTPLSGCRGACRWRCQGDIAPVVAQGKDSGSTPHRVPVHAASTPARPRRRTVGWTRHPTRLRGSCVHR